MKLIRFRVTDFRSVKDSGWVHVESVTALIGTNESGKTNVLLPLWKLNPAKGGEINPSADYPRKRFTEIRNMEKKPTFIRARFELSDGLARQISRLSGKNQDEVSVVEVSRDFDGNRYVRFPQEVLVRSLPLEEVNELICRSLATIRDRQERATEKDLKAQMLSALEEVEDRLSNLNDNNQIDLETLRNFQTILDNVDVQDPLKTSVIVPEFAEIVSQFDALVKRASRPSLSSNKQVTELVLNDLPSFVYYSNYGNLDSEIYLPHVIENMSRTDLGAREEAKARTLKVLFEFVGLDPQEILELGHDFDLKTGTPTQQQIEEVSEKKKQREILLQSAEARLTQEFRNWWKQGDYIFTFRADGDHFRIWVSDDRRPEKIELEGRSTGLQWFLSFYLVFLVESKDAHKDAILLLDEAGLSLHPLAQRDLSLFFDGLSETNQIIYTTHSPFLIDSDHLSRVNAVYVNKQGETEVSQNLRAGEPNSAQTQSIYAVHAALGLTVSEGILQGCTPIIVEGPSDQIYLSMIKIHLIAQGLITPKGELVFLTSGGIRGIQSVASILTAKDEILPIVLVDSDKSGEDFKKKLSSGLYQDSKDRIVSIGDYCSVSNAEIEDILPTNIIAREIERELLRRASDYFTDVVDTDKPLVPQVEEFAQRHQIELPKGWKVDIARRVKEQLLKQTADVDKALEEQWKRLFDKFSS